MRIIDAVIDAIYPPYCACCGNTIIPERYFCTDCGAKIKSYPKNSCKRCGIELKLCECDRFIYHFDGVCGAFKNEGFVKDALYDYKFKQNERLSAYFADKIAKRVVADFPEIRFDFVTSVPPTEHDTDYDHAKIIARKVAKRLKLKFVTSLSAVATGRKTQHHLSFEERFANVHDSYSALGSYKGKTVLIVDDIKTSGATLDECARQLKFAGAENVFCAVALIGHRKSDR